MFYNIQAHKVIIGSKAEDGSYYIRVDDYPSIYKASASALPWAEAVYSNSVSTSLFTKNITSVSAVTIRTDDGKPASSWLIIRMRKHPTNSWPSPAAARPIPPMNSAVCIRC